MATSVTLPALGESVTEGTVTRWLKQPGEEVKADEPLLEVSTDKVDTEIPSPASGTLLEIKVAEDETVEVGTELAVIGEPSEGNGSGQPEQPASEEATASAGATSAADEVQPAQPPADAAQPAESSQTAGAATSPAQSEPPAAGGGSAGGTPVTLPALGESVTEGTVTRWLKQVGEEVRVDEPLLEVSTDKVDTEIPSPASGTLLEIKVAEDETVEVGTELAVIGSADSSDGLPQAPADQAQAAEQVEATAPAEQAPAAQAPAAQAPAEQAAPAAQTPAVQAAPAEQAPPSAERPSGDSGGGEDAAEPEAEQEQEPPESEPEQKQEEPEPEPEPQEQPAEEQP
ncbi:MAG TPA: biotin/lipoyl-containing protein, partial [Jiangellaceae bacterium]|nr:biotin/lipoyl-containing protein [Jiangellaceae bacterium]